MKQFVYRPIPEPIDLIDDLEKLLGTIVKR